MADLEISIGIEGETQLAGFFAAVPRVIADDLTDLWNEHVWKVLARSWKKTFNDMGRPKWRGLTPKYARSKDLGKSATYFQVIAESSRSGGQTLRRRRKKARIMHYPIGNMPVKFGGDVIGKLTGALAKAATRRGAPANVFLAEAQWMFWGVDPSQLPHAPHFDRARRFVELNQDILTGVRRQGLRWMRKRLKGLALVHGGIAQVT